jgi:DNA gyrase subunit A
MWIAVGWATNLPPHNLTEVVNVIKAYIKNPNLTIKEIIKIMPGPDFPSHGKLLGQKGVFDYYTTGHGCLELEGLYEIDKEEKHIVITELPYQGSPAELEKEIENLVKNDVIQGISDMKNLSSKKTGIMVVIDVAKNGNAKLIVNNLLKHTCLRKTINVNQTVLINGKVCPDVGIIQLIKAFVEHRKTILSNKYNAELIKAEQRVHVLEGLIKASKHIDKVIEIIRKANSPEDAQVSLIKWDIASSELQAKAVLAITLRQLTKLEANKLSEDKIKLDERITWVKKVLSSDSEILNLIVKEQEEIVKILGDDRRTKIVKESVDINDEDLIEDERLVVSLSGSGYIKSTSIDAYKIQQRGGKGASGVNDKDETEIFEIFEANSKDIVLFFTNLGLMYQKKVYEIPQGQKTSKGIHVSNLLNLSENEAITNTVSVKTLDQDGCLLMVTEKGLIKRSEIREYDSTRKNSGLIAISLDEDDKAAFAFISDCKKDVFIITECGLCVRYAEDVVPIHGRGTRGSKAIRLSEEDHVAHAFILNPNEDCDILVVTSKGFGKRTNSKDYKTSDNKGGKGYAVIKKKTLDKNGKIVAGCCVNKNDTILVLTSGGKTIRIDSSAIRATGRTTAGVRLVKLEDGENIIKIAKLKNEAIENL